MVDLARLKQIVECGRRMSDASEELARLTEPSAVSRDILMECYKKQYPTDWSHPDRTRILLFVWLYLYDPAALSGARMRNNTRKMLTEVLGVKTPQTISVRARNLLFCYKTFPSFKRKVDELISLASQKLA